MPHSRTGYVFRDKLILVMGLQRSGTSALVEALGQDPELRVETEHPGNDFYDDYFLRPEPVLRPLLWRIRRRVVLKPISEIQRRTVDDVLDEWADYGPQVAWIYRDPVNVWSSNVVEFGMTREVLPRWIREWNEGNRFILRSLRGKHAERIVVVRYEDLIADRGVFAALCRFLKVRDVNNLFWREDAKKGRRRLPDQVQAEIERGVDEVLRELHACRLRPHSVKGRTAIDGAAVSPDADAAWRLYAEGEERARLELPADRPSLAIVHVADAADPNSVLLAHSPVRVRKGQTYTYSAWLRSTRQRPAAMGFGQEHDPWESIGGYRDLELSPDWQYVRGEFTAAEDDHRTRVFFPIGQAAGAVEIADIAIAEGTRRLHRLECHDGARAALEFDPAAPGAIRIKAIRSGAPPCVQLTELTQAISKEKRYILTMRLRAARPRLVDVAVGENQAPWQRLEFHRRLSALPQWTTFRHEFIAEDSDLVRVYFDLGADDAAVDIADVELKEDASPLRDLYVREGRQAEMEFLPELPMVARVRIDDSGDGAGDGIQLSRTGPLVEQSRRYGLRFRAQSDSPRRIAAAVSGFIDDEWTGLGLFQRVELTPGFRDFYFEFVAEKGAETTSIHFDLGQDAVPVEFADVELRNVEDDLSDEEVRQLERAVDSIRG